MFFLGLVASSSAMGVGELDAVPSEPLLGELRKGTMSVWDGLACNITNVVGSGIFVSPGLVLMLVGGDPLLAVLAWVLGAFVCAAGSVSIVELACWHPSAGGVMTYLHMVFGDVVAFSYLLFNFFVVLSTALVLLSITTSMYVGALFGLESPGVQEVPSAAVRAGAGLAIVLVVALNCWSSRISAALLKGCTLVTFTGCFYITALGVAVVASGRSEPIQWRSDSPNWWGLAPATVQALWSYLGWADVAAISEEMRDGPRNLPRASLGGLLVITLIYVTLNLLYLCVLPAKVVGTSLAVGVAFAEEASAILGAPVLLLKGCICCLVAVCALGAMNGVTFLGSRQFHGAAQQGVFPKFMAKLRADGSTPYLAAMCLGACSLVILMAPASFKDLVNYVSICLWLYYALACCCRLVLHGASKWPWEAIGGPLWPMVFSACVLVMCSMTAAQSPVCGAASIVCFLVGPVVFFAKRLYMGKE